MGIDPISNLTSMGTTGDVHAALMRLIDFLKNGQITCLCTNLTQAGTRIEQSAVSISSLTDTWILVRDIESNGERNRGLYVVKSRGMARTSWPRAAGTASAINSKAPARHGPPAN